MTIPTKVVIIESERGWGQKVDEVKEFPTLQDAEAFVKQYNDQHNPPGPVPDWYMVAMLQKDWR